MQRVPDRTQTPWTRALPVLALLAVAACTGGERCRRPTTSATGARDGAAAQLVLRSVPDGEVWVDGVAHGLTPLAIDVEPGARDIVIALGGFVLDERTVNVPAGGRRVLETHLVTKDPFDPEVLQLLAHPHGIWVAPFDPPETARDAAGVSAPAPVYPQGKVRLTDLGEYRIDLPEEAPESLTIRFLDGEALLFEASTPLKGKSVVLGVLPDEVKQTIKEGSTVTWGVYPEDGAPATVSFEVVADPVKGVLNGLAKGLADQPPEAAAFLRAQVLSDAGLHFAAHQTAMKSIRAGKPSVRAWAVVLSALDQMGVPKGAGAWKQAQAQIAKFSKDDQADVYFQPGQTGRRLRHHMAAGEAARALFLLDDTQVSVLAESPARTRRLAAFAASTSRWMGERSPGAARKFADRLLDLAKKTRTQLPDDPQSSIALALAQLGHARVLRETASASTTPQLWIDAALNVGEAYVAGLEDKGDALVEAVWWLREAAGLDDADLSVLEARSAGFVAVAEDRFPDTDQAVCARAIHQLLVARGSPSTRAKKHYTEVVESLAPLLEKTNPLPYARRIHTAAVAEAKRRRVGRKLDFRTLERVSGEGLLAYAIPDAPSWRVVTPTPAGEILRIDQLGEDDRPVRMITLRAAARGQKYVFPGGIEVDGHNASLMSDADLREVRRGFKKVRGKPRSTRRVLNRGFRKAYAYEIKGTDRRAAYRRVRGWTWHSKEHGVTYLLQVFDQGDLGKKHPALDLFLDSLKDVDAD